MSGTDIDVWEGGGHCRISTDSHQTVVSPNNKRIIVSNHLKKEIMLFSTHVVLHI